MNQYCGWIGETSTEVAAGIDYHPDAVMPPVITGDVNGDGEVSVSDINSVIDVILGGATLPSADVNGDGEVGVSDVNALIGIIIK